MHNVQSLPDLLANSILLIQPTSNPMETRIKTLQNARDEGHQAAKEGEMLNENPYPSNTEHHDAWRKAWNNAEKDSSTPEQSPGSGTAGSYVAAHWAKLMLYLTLYEKDDREGLSDSEAELFYLLSQEPEIQDAIEEKRAAT